MDDKMKVYVTEPESTKICEFCKVNGLEMVAERGTEDGRRWIVEFKPTSYIKNTVGNHTVFGDGHTLDEAILSLALNVSGKTLVVEGNGEIACPMFDCTETGKYTKVEE